MKPEEQTCRACSDTFEGYLHDEYCSPKCYYSGYSFDSDDSITFKTVGGYEVLTDGESSVRVHQLQACLDNDPHDVFNSTYMNVHHLNTVPWDNREENLLLLRARYHKNLHDNIPWQQIIDYYNKNDVADTELQPKEKRYRTLTEKYLEE